MSDSLGPSIIFLSIIHLLINSLSTSCLPDGSASTVVMNGHGSIRVVGGCLTSDVVTFFESLHIYVLLVHGLIERNHDRSVGFKAHVFRVIVDRTDLISRKGDCAVVFGKDLNVAFHFIGVNNFPTVTFEISSGNVNSHASDFSIGSLSVRFACDKAIVLGRIISLC